MSHDLTDKHEFLVAPSPSTTTGYNNILVQKLLLNDLNTTPILTTSWETVFTVSSTSTLRINGELVPNNRLVPLMNKLKNEHLMVNCNGLCFLKTTINSGTVYLRLFDVFQWPLYGITQFKFVGFPSPKYLNGGVISPQNLSPPTTTNTGTGPTNDTTITNGTSTGPTTTSSGPITTSTGIWGWRVPTVLPFSNTPDDDDGRFRSILRENYKEVPSSCFEIVSNSRDTYWSLGGINYTIETIEPSADYVSDPFGVRIYQRMWPGDYFDTNDWLCIATTGSDRFAFYAGQYISVDFYSRYGPNLVYGPFSGGFKSNKPFGWFRLRGVGYVYGFRYY